MRTRIPGVNKFKTILSRILIGLIFVSMIGGLSFVTAFGDDHRRPEPGGHYRGHIEHREAGRYRYEHGRRVYRPYGYGYYRSPVYAPPPVIYAPPPPPPGISIFLPPIVIR